MNIHPLNQKKPLNKLILGKLTKNVKLNLKVKTFHLKKNNLLDHHQNMVLNHHNIMQIILPIKIIWKKLDTQLLIWLKPLLLNYISSKFQKEISWNKLIHHYIKLINWKKNKEETERVGKIFYLRQLFLNKRKWLLLKLNLFRKWWKNSKKQIQYKPSLKNQIQWNKNYKK